MKGFVQEKSGKYYLVLDLYDERGRRRPKWISTGLPVRGNKRKAEAKLDEVLARYEETGELPTGRSHAYQITPPGCKPREQNVLTKADMPFLDYLEEWLLQRRSVIQPATYISYSSIVHGRVRDFFKPLNVTLGGVTPQMLDEFQSQILMDGDTANTVIHYHAVLRKALQDAVRKDYIPKNPADRVERPRKNTFRNSYYQKEELTKLFEVSKDDPIYLCILIAAYYGLRRSEVLGLTWSAIDFEGKTLSVNHKVTEVEKDGKICLIVSDVMKNKSSCRTLPLIPTVEKALREQQRRQQTLRELLGSAYSDKYLDFVCTDQQGELLRPAFLSEHFAWLLEKHKMRHIRFHDLRHSCASLMLANGVPMKQIQEWLGHSTFSTTADIYAHLDYRSKQNSAGVIAQVLG